MMKKRLGKKKRTVFKNEKLKPDIMIDFLEDYVISSLLFLFPPCFSFCIFVRSGRKGWNLKTAKVIYRGNNDKRTTLKLPT